MIRGMWTRLRIWRVWGLNPFYSWPLHVEVMGRKAIREAHEKIQEAHERIRKAQEVLEELSRGA